MDLSNLMQVLAPIISGLAGEYGAVAQVLMWIGTFRLLFKPIMTCIQAVVDVTPTQVDNEILAKVMASVPYKAISFVLDLVVSIKLPQAQPPAEVPAPAAPTQQ